MKKKWIPGLLALALMLGGCGAEEIPAETQVPTVSIAAPSQDSPMGPRKIMNWRGCRYAFLENGAEYKVLPELLGEPLGTLEGDILSDPETWGRTDLGATFALGGTVREVALYDPAFRVAVELEGRVYLCENVDRIEGPVDLHGYYEAADFRIDSVDILDHMGREALKTPEDLSFVEKVFMSTEAELSEEDFQSIGQAQQEGKSFLIRLNLEDGTAFSFYLIPELNLAMVGDNRYILPEDMTSLVEGLEQGPLPMN